MDEIYPELTDNDQNEHVNDSDLFSIDNDPEVVFDDNNCEICMPKNFGDETKFSEPISENMAKFIKMGCTQKADISKFLEDVNIPENCKNLVPPLINSEIWSLIQPCCTTHWQSNSGTEYLYHGGSSPGHYVCR